MGNRAHLSSLLSVYNLLGEAKHTHTHNTCRFTAINSPSDISHTVHTHTCVQTPSDSHTKSTHPDAHAPSSRGDIVGRIERPREEVLRAIERTSVVYVGSRPHAFHVSAFIF